MSSKTLLKISGLDDVEGRRLSRIKVRIRIKTSSGETSATATVDSQGQVLLPKGISSDAELVGASIVDVKGPELQLVEIDTRPIGEMLREPQIPVLTLNDDVIRVLNQKPPESLSWTRNGRFSVLGHPDYSFSGLDLFVSVVLPGEAESTFRAIAGEGDLPPAFSGTAPANLVGIPQHRFFSARLSFDGGFQFAIPTELEAAGWIWLLSGQTNLVGYRADDVETRSRSGINILLPGEFVSQLRPAEARSGRAVDPTDKSGSPLQISERELLEHPELFSDDPGPFCEPFKNPERILGERRFRTILRVEQPDIAAAAGIRLKAKVDQLREAADDLLTEGVGGGIDTDDIARAFETRRRQPIGELFNMSEALDPVGPAGGRRSAGSGTLIDWEGDTSDNQAVTVVGGHILEWRVRWRSNGYSLGNVNHTLTLAPRQIKRIMKIDFERRERAVRREELRLEDEVEQGTEATRDYRDAVAGSLSEWVKGHSKSKATGFGAGYGSAAAASAPVAPGVVVSGGSAFGAGITHGRAESEASQEGGRRVAASEEQNLRDAIRQYGESLRELESTVITEINQEESVEGVSELIANPNFCHALTVVYYDILRHLRVDTELGGVSECLFVPFAIMPFTSHRWHGDVLISNYSRIIQHIDALEDVLKERSLKWVLRYLQDYVNNGNEDLPDGPRMNQALTSLRGALDIEIHIASPLNGNEDSEVTVGEAIADTVKRAADLTKKIADKVLPFPKLRRKIGKFAGKLALLSPSEREDLYQREHAPTLARYLVERLQLLDTDGNDLEADFTLDGAYASGRKHRVYFTVRPSNLANSVTRAEIADITVKLKPEPAMQGFMPLGGMSGLDLDRPLFVPSGSVMNVVGAKIQFRTEHYQRGAKTGGFKDDLITTVDRDPSVPAESEGSGALLEFPPSAWEEQNLKREIRRAVTKLSAHLEDHLHYYHKWIWWKMDRDELYTLLDGYTISDSDSRSIASVIDRSPLAILGNMLVFRVARGAEIGVNGFSLREARDYYEKEQVSPDPIRVSLPTGGVYAQALRDRCNACEEHYGSTDWVLERDDLVPQELSPSLLQSRRSAPENLSPTTMPETIINLQNAPAPPAPSGTAGVLNTVGSSAGFTDMAGLAGTQANTRLALEQAKALASEFGHLAAKEADANRAAMERIEISKLSAEAKKAAAKPITDDKKDPGPTPKPKPDEDNGDDDRPVPKGDDDPKSTPDNGGGGGRSGGRPRTTEYFRVLSPTRVLFFNFPVGGDQTAAGHGPHIRATLQRIEGARSVKLIQGHASRTGSVEDNRDLSSRRATNLLVQFEEHSLQSWPRSLTQGVGEEDPTIRSMFGSQLTDIPGAGHQEDPVERSVLVEFESPVFEEPEPDEPAPGDDGDIEITLINDFSIQIGDERINVHVDNSFTDNSVTDNSVTVIHQVTGDTIVTNNVVNEMGPTTINNVVVQLHEENVLRIGDQTFEVTVGGLKKIPGGTAAGGNPVSRNWQVAFKTPVPGGEDLFELIRRIATGAVAEQVSEAETRASTGDRSWLEALESGIDSLGDTLTDALVDQLLNELANQLPGAPLLRSLKIGQSEVPATITSVLSGKTKTGVIRGPALSFSTLGESAPRLMTINAEQDFSTVQARTLDSWNGQQFARLSIFVHPVGQLLSQLWHAIQAALGVIKRSMPSVVEDAIDGIEARIQESLDSVLSVFGISITTSQLPRGLVQFTPTNDDSLNEFNASAPSIDLITIIYGENSCSFEDS